VSLGENLRELYYSAMDSLLGFFERFGWKKTAFAIGILIVACAVVIFFLAQQPEVQTVSVELEFVDEEGNSLAGLEFEYSVNEGHSLEGETDSRGSFSIEVIAGSEVLVAVERDGFEGLETTIFTGKSDMTETIALRREAAKKERKILRFEDSGGLITGKLIMVRIECENRAISPWREADEDLDGIIEVELPLNCGLISVTVEESGYNPSLEKFREGEKEKIIRLREKEPEKGSLVVRIENELGETERETNFLARIEGVSYSDEAYSEARGKVEFADLLPGYYDIIVADPQGNYSTERALFIEVKPSIAREVTVTMTRKKVGFIKVTVLDQESGARVKNATVKLKDMQDILLEEKNTGANGSTVEFWLKEEQALRIIAKKEGGIGEGYFPKSVDLNDINRDIEIRIERITEEKSGRTIVTVQDEDGMAVENAKVMFRYADTGGIVELPDARNYKFSDENGMARFSLGVLERAVYPFAVKYPASGGSAADSALISSEEVNEFNVRLSIGDCTLLLRAVGEDSELVPESEFEIFNSEGESLSGKVPMVEGEANYTLKADERVYVVFESPGYLRYQSEEVQLWPDRSFEIIGEMQKRVSLERPRIFFRGFFSEGREVKALIAGGKYEAVFIAAMPLAEEYGKLGFNVRLGDESDVSNDPLFITGVNAGNPDSLLFGETFNPPKGFEREQLTEGKAKWANIEWLSPVQESYKISVEFKVRDSTLPKTRLSLHYRAYAVRDGKYYRQPEDLMLGVAEDTSAKDGFYAKANSIVFFEGVSPSCEEDFCVSGEWLFGVEEQLFIEKPYTVQVFSDYNYSFVLFNNSPRTYSNSRIEIRNEFEGERDGVLRLKKARIRNASGETLEVEPEDNEIVLDELGDFTQNKEVEVELFFEPVEIKDSQFKIVLVADGVISLEKTPEFRVVSAEEMELVVSPEVIPAFIENIVEAKVTRNGEALEGALLRLTAKMPGTEHHVLSKHSNSLGFAVFEIPALPPGTVVLVEAEKAGYAPARAEKTVSEEVLRVIPHQLEAQLHSGSKKSEEFALEVENLTGMELELEEALFLGETRGLLDLGAMNAFSQMNAGKKIPALDSAEVRAIKVVLSSEARELMQGNESLELELVLVFGNRARNAEYSVTLPVLVEISLAGLPENAPCIYLDGADVPEWRAFTAKNQARTEFEIINACEQSSRPVNLESLVARIDWDSSISGIVELTVSSPDGATASQALTPGKKAKLFDNFRSWEHGTYNAIVTFTPKTGYLGKTAEFTLSFDGEVLSDAGLVLVNNDRSASVNGEIKIVNLEDCVQLPDEIISAGEQGGDFALSLGEECGDISIDIELCRGDQECSGGTEGGITVTPKTFTLSGAQAEKTVSVYGKEIPGMYGVPVHVKMQGGSFKLAGIVDVLVEPGEQEYLSLSRYEAVLTKEAEWKDTLEVTNSFFSEEVQVTANYCTECKHADELPEECHWNIVLKEMAEKKHTAETWLNSVFSAAATGFGACAVTGNIITMITCAAVLTGVEAIELFIDVVWGPECEITQETFPLNDYVLLLEELNADIAPGGFSAQYSGAETEKILTEKKEIGGLDIMNASHTEEPLPLYGTLELVLPEHVHGDPLHLNPALKFDDANFGPFDLEDSETRVYSQKFHLKIVTGSSFEFEDLSVPVPEDVSPCVMGARVGYSGENALPRIKLGWEWSDEEIAWNSCDEDNNQAFYCDATQFSIALSKRLHKLEEFFSENDYSFSCPRNPAIVAVEEFIEEHGEEQKSREVEEGKIGVKLISYELDGNMAKVRVTVHNRAEESAYADVKVVLSGPEGYAEERERTTAVIPAGDTANVECGFSDLGESGTSFYTASAYVESAAVDEDQGVAFVYFVVTGAEEDCWLGFSTKKLEGHPTIEYFINENLPNWEKYVTEKSVSFPSDWPGESRDGKLQFLRKLLEFNALLVKDSFSEDFMQDFSAHYSDEQFFEVPEWFAGEDNAVGEMFSEERVSIKGKYSGSSALSSPGTYTVLIGIDFSGKWSLFADGEPDANVDVELYKLKEPVPNSIFYYLPFDGRVGYATSNGRQGYGLNYDAEGEEVMLIGGGNALPLSPIMNSNALGLASTSIEAGVEKLNSRAGTRGMLLRFTKNENDAGIEFAPSHATPVAMVFSHAASGQPFKAEFGLFDEDTPVNTGGNLSFWTGLGQCLDFSGEPIADVFYYLPDSASGQNSYALEWSGAEKEGTVFISSIFFTPTGKRLVLKAQSPEMQFFTPNAEESGTVQLGGIDTMPFNYQESTETIDSVRRVFSLVREEKVCVTNSGNESMFWWNPSALFGAKGSYASIEEFSESLKAGENCIGAGS